MQHPEASCAVDRNMRRSDSTSEYLLTSLRNYFREKQIIDPTVWKALREAQWLMQHPWIARVLWIIRRRIGPVGISA